VARYWIEQGIDGWRLDVPNEINDDGLAAVQAGSSLCKSGSYLVGEIWDGDSRWVVTNISTGL